MAFNTGFTPGTFVAKFHAYQRLTIAVVHLSKINAADGNTRRLPMW
jgi:hypothetical protein